MKLAEFFKRLLGGRKEPPSNVYALLDMLAATEDLEVSCDQVYAVVEQFAEAARNNEDVRALWPQIQKHLDMCPDCREEFEGLLSMLQAPA